MRQHARFKKSSLLAKIVIVAALAYAAFSLLSLHAQITGAQAEVDALSRQVLQQRQPNANLQAGTAHGGSAQAQMEDAARDRLGLVLQNEKVFYDVGG